ncbi:hypothetical protein T08_6233 [Trichinella sp. T8]|nr:hypothetical protein T08_6233 [Trichinella sp. T8]
MLVTNTEILAPVGYQNPVMNVDFPHDNSRTTFSYVMIVSAAYYVATAVHLLILCFHASQGHYHFIYPMDNKI